MLHHLHVRNLAVIEEAGIELGGGLNVLTGETGAGKSIVVDSLALLSGARASSELIRSGAETLTVTGIFEPRGQRWRSVLANAGVDVEGPELTVRREISRSGRNRVFIDDRPVTLGLLAALAPELLRIHTQREELGLVSPELQRAWLDRSAGTAAELLRDVRQSYQEYETCAERLAGAQGGEQLRRERIDLLRFQAAEIDAARVRPDEDRDLKAEREVLRHSEAIAAALGLAYGLLFEEEGAAAERIAGARRRLADIGAWESRSSDWTVELQSLQIRLEELAGDLHRRLEQIDSDPSRLEQIEERLSVLDRLRHKYGVDCSGLLQLRNEIEGELAVLDSDESSREELAKRANEALERFRAAATSLSEQRLVWASQLADRVHAELADLALAKARFSVAVERRRRGSSPLVVDGRGIEFGEHGIDDVTYLLAANPGEEMLPVSSSASGGELSRVYLAVQLAIRSSGPAVGSTLVFDEVDAGIGGAEAAALGRKLARLAEGGQILAVSHLPQVASHADRHFRVEKKVERGRTRTRVVSLSGDARIEEVARMMTGRKITDLSLSHARELISSANGGEG